MVLVNSNKMNRARRSKKGGASPPYSAGHTVKHSVAVREANSQLQAAARNDLRLTWVMRALTNSL